MKILINDLNSKNLETISSENLDNLEETLKKFSSMKEPLEINCFAINESITSSQLLYLKNNLNIIKICFLRIYSNDRNTVLAGKSLKIDSIFLQEQEVRKKLLLLNQKTKEDFLYEGTVRSGDRISSNGNLFIIGDVNPGAIVSAENNIYVWGKLRGIAFAGKDGNVNATISSLYLNPLQLRIADKVALGPKEKPKNSYPEIALIHNQKIFIKPYIVDT